MISVELVYVIVLQKRFGFTIDKGAGGGNPSVAEARSVCNRHVAAGAVRTLATAGAYGQG